MREKSMENKMRLSIIVTVYNREKYLRRCIESLLDQDISENEYEIVIVDDGSTDSSGRIMDAYSAQYHHIRVFHKENSGVADTRNCGLENARGEYITYVDSDDYVEKNCYRPLLEWVEQKNCDILICDYYKTFEDHREYEEIATFLPEGQITAKEYIRTTPSPCNKLMRRELFMRGNIRFPHGIFYEDYATIPLLANEAKIIYYEKKAFLNYFQENTSITRNIGYQKKWWDMYTASQNLNKLNPEYHDELEYIIYLYLLVRTSSWYLQARSLKEVEMIAAYFVEHFPKWRKNIYIKRRPQKERFIAYMLCRKAAKFILWSMSLKKRMKINDKKN